MIPATGPAGAPPVPAPPPFAGGGRGRWIRRVSAFVAATEFAGVTAVAAAMSRTVASFLIGVGALVAAVALWPRSDDRTHLDRLLLRLRLQARGAGARRAARDGEPGQAAFAPPYRPLSVTTASGPHGPVGVGQDADGWFVVLETTLWESLRGEPEHRLDLGRLAQILVLHPAPVSTVQIVVHTTPAVTTPGGAATHIGASYQELFGAGSRIAAAQVMWLALRISASSLAGRDTSGAGVQRALVAAAGWGTRTLRRLGLTGRVLDRAGVLDALARSWALDPVPGNRGRVTEGWSSLQADDLAHACFAVRAWTPSAHWFPLAALTDVDAITDVAVVLRPGAETVELDCVLRVAASPERLPPATQMATAQAATMGILLRRLDGQHALGAAASAPTGGAPAGLGLPRYRGTPATVTAVTLPVEATGLVIGQERRGAPVVVRAFRDRPTTIALVGGGWITRILVFRALALGAHVTLCTAAPEPWLQHQQALGPAGDLYVFTTDPQVPPVGGTDRRPALHVIEGTAAGPGHAPAYGPWQTRLTVVSDLESPGSAVPPADMTMLQRLTARGEHAARSTLAMTEETGQLLQSMGDDMVAVVGGGADRYVWVGATSVEQHLFGPPRRG